MGIGTTLDDTIDAETRHLLARRSEWSISAGARDLELTSHALRALLQLDRVIEDASEFLALADAQRADGGWNSALDEAPSGPWVSAFAALTCARAARVLPHASLTRAVARAVDFFLAHQAKDGSWSDPPTWTRLDATSHPLSFLHIARGGSCPRAAEVDAARVAAVGFILMGQDRDGAFREPGFRSPTKVVASGSAVEMTAHILEDSLSGALSTAKSGPPVVRQAAQNAAQWLAGAQIRDGSWDGGNVDHTMDATRALMLAQRVLPETDVHRTIEAAMAWILAARNPQGWGDFPGEPTNLERACDGLDTLVKYRAYRLDQVAPIVRLWGYAVA
jgi:squalene cyclase